MQGKSPNQRMDENGLKRKKKYDDYAAPEIVREDRTVCAANQNKSVNKSANISFGGFFNANKLINSKTFCFIFKFTVTF